MDEKELIKFAKKGEMVFDNPRSLEAKLDIIFSELPVVPFVVKTGRKYNVHYSSPSPGGRNNIDKFRGLLDYVKSNWKQYTFTGGFKGILNCQNIWNPEPRLNFSVSIREAGLLSQNHELKRVFGKIDISMGESSFPERCGLRIITHEPEDYYNSCFSIGISSMQGHAKFYLESRALKEKTDSVTLNPLIIN